MITQLKTVVRPKHDQRFLSERLSFQFSEQEVLHFAPQRRFHPVGACQVADTPCIAGRLAGADTERRLRLAVEEIKERYEFIFVDCPPSLNMLTVRSPAHNRRTL